MAKYSIGDKVQIIMNEPSHPMFTKDMRKYLGTTMTVQEFHDGSLSGIESIYKMSEDSKWFWKEEWIAGFAEELDAQKNEVHVNLQFCGLLTIAELVRNGKTVKIAIAQCNPNDTYDRAEGARVAVNKLFEKKSKSAVGKKFTVVSNGSCPLNYYSIGETVIVTEIYSDGNYGCVSVRKCVAGERLSQTVNPNDLAPYCDGYVF